MFTHFLHVQLCLICIFFLIQMFLWAVGEDPSGSRIRKRRSLLSFYCPSSLLRVSEQLQFNHKRAEVLGCSAPFSGFISNLASVFGLICSLAALFLITFVLSLLTLLLLTSKLVQLEE